MISLIEALNYRCLRHVRQPLGPFHVLVGPNASGKSTFLDVIAFLGRLVSDGLEAAVEERTSNFYDLLWGRQGERLALAVEAVIPAELRQPESLFDRVRYEVCVGIDLDEKRIAILVERVLLLADSVNNRRLEDLPDKWRGRRIAVAFDELPGTQLVVEKKYTLGDFYIPESRTGSSAQGNIAWDVGTRKTALGSLPEDQSKFPIAVWLKKLLVEGIQPLAIDSRVIQKVSPPLKGLGLGADGSNLPWVIDYLRLADPKRFQRWIDHIQMVLPDIETIRIVERSEDKHRYLMIRYQGGLEVPSWTVSEGTLRLLALTIPAYLVDFTGAYLIEEPENGIHPRAVEAVYQSLSSVYKGQVLVATHSPLLVGLVDPDKILCFNKNDEGATEIVLGSEHPALRDWSHEVDLGTLFAGGFLE